MNTAKSNVMPRAADDHSIADWLDTVTREGAARNSTFRRMIDSLMVTR